MSVTTSCVRDAQTSRLTARLPRVLFLLALTGGAVAGLAIGARSGAPTADADLAGLLRAMAVLKLLFLAAATVAVLWRLRRPIGPVRLGAYAAAAAAMAAGPGLIWFFSHLVVASVLLHGGMVAMLVLLWRDPTIGTLLEQAIARRRLAVRMR